MKLLKCICGPNFLAPAAACIVYRICSVTGWQEPTISSHDLCWLPLGASERRDFHPGHPDTGSYGRMTAGGNCACKDSYSRRSDCEAAHSQAPRKSTERALEFLCVEEKWRTRRLRLAN